MLAGHPINDLGEYVAVDTETTGLNVYKGDRPYLISFCDEEGNCAAVQWPVNPRTRGVVVNNRDLPTLCKFFRNRDRTLVFQNSLFDIPMLESVGLRWYGNFEEVMFAAGVCNNLEPSLQLKYLAKKYCDIGTDDESELKKEVIKQRRIAKKRGWKISESVEADYWLAPQLVLVYALEDAVRTISLWINVYRDQLHQPINHHKPDEGTLQDTYDFEKRLWYVTRGMQRRGVRIFPRLLKEETADATHRRDEAFAELERLAPEVDNFNSSKQLLKVFERLGIDTGERTPTGKMSMAAKHLDPLSHPFVEKLMHYRAAQAALSDFFLRYADLAVPDADGLQVMHPSFQQVGPRTGRYSCRQPNMQNVSDANLGKSIVPILARKPLGPRPGMLWFHLDYDQLEVRIFASVADETFMLDAIRSGRDLHTECTNLMCGGKDNPTAVTAAKHALSLDGTVSGELSAGLVKEVIDSYKGSDLADDPDALAMDWLAQFNYDIVEAEKSLKKKPSRTIVKMLMFLKIFGGGLNSAKKLIKDTTEEQLRQFLKHYDEVFPRIPAYMKQLSKQAERDGYIVNAYNKRLMIDPDKSYKCVNYMVQGSAASLLKDRMVACADYCAARLRPKGIEAHLLLTIHDELVFEVCMDFPWWALRELKELMEDNEGRFQVETTVSVEVTDTNWSQKKAYNLERGSYG